MSEKKAIRLAYGEALAELGKENPKIVALDADLAGATMSGVFRSAFPDRHYNCGIAEANMVDVATGMSLMGLIPFCSTFAVFAGRCYEQIRNSVCYSRNNVKFAFSHAGITVGEDGGSHQAIEDLALMRSLPNMTVIVPGDATECGQAVRAAAEWNGPVYIRLARLPTDIYAPKPFVIGRANPLAEGKDAVLFCCGIMVEMCLAAAELLKARGKEVSVVNMHTLKPVDRETVLQYASKCHNVFTVEEHSVIGGLGDAVADVLIDNGSFRFTKIGINDQFGQSGKPMDLLQAYGLSAECIAQRVLDRIE